jgi:TRIAD3 protein (E3 ubiquitin-protein ligase RNF216)
MSVHELAEALTDVFLRQCSACGHRFYKEEGCNSMTCVCGRRMCYVCRARIDGTYAHFCNCGGLDAACLRCHLYTDVAVKDAALMAALAQRHLLPPESDPSRC